MVSVRNGCHVNNQTLEWDVTLADDGKMNKMVEKQDQIKTK